jgi:DNA polymerase III epsilon subunit-like protein
MYSTSGNENTMRELFIAVDVETTGPIPGKYSMFEIGATCIDMPQHEFVAHLLPISDTYDPEALSVTNTTIATLRESGEDPTVAMERFEKWVISLQKRYNARPVCVAINAPFDWMFIAYYFHTFLGRNPFGYTALDLKAYFAGRVGCTWRVTQVRKIWSIHAGAHSHIPTGHSMTHEK